MPTTPNTPLFQHEEQGQVEFTGFFNGMNLKTACTPVKHLAFQANGHFVTSYDMQNPNQRFHKYAEGAIGTYYCFKNSAVIELYGGYGEGASVFGDQIFSDFTLLVRAKGHYKKYYGQINFGQHTRKKGLMGACLRVGNVRYTYTDANFRSLVNETIDHFSVEPYFFMTTKLADHLSFVTNIGLTIIEGNTTAPNEATIRTNILNIGVGLRLSLGADTE